jgi:hypothetical protein
VPGSRLEGSFREACQKFATIQQAIPALAANATPLRAVDRNVREAIVRIVLYAGEQQFSSGDRLTALPMAALWTLDRSDASGYRDGHLSAGQA